MNEIINDYTAGKKTLKETNEALKKGGYGLVLDPNRNVISQEEFLATTAGDTPETVNGWGLMDHGVGCMEKVHVVDGRTVDVDMGQETAFVSIAGRRYRLWGDVLREED